VGITTSESRPASAAWIASACSGRSRSKPHHRASTSAIRGSVPAAGADAGVSVSAGPGTALPFERLGSRGTVESSGYQSPEPGSGSIDGSESWL